MCFFVNKKKGNNNNSQKKKKLVIRRSDQLIPAAAAAGFCVSDWSPSRPIEVRAFPSDAIVSDRPGLVKKKVLIGCPCSIESNMIQFGQVLIQ